MLLEALVQVMYRTQEMRDVLRRHICMVRSLFTIKRVEVCPDCVLSLLQERSVVSP